MKEALPKLSQKTLTGSTSVIFSLVSAAGLSRSDLREFRKTRLAGREARLANRLARRESNSDSSTRDTSHLCSSTSSASAALQSSLGNRLRQQLQNRGCAIYRFTWKEKTTPSGLPYSQLVASALRTKENDSSLVRTNWPTPTANDYKGSGETVIRKDGKDRTFDRLDYSTEHGLKLTNWPTPRSSDGEKNVRTLEGSLSEIQRKGGGTSRRGTSGGDNATNSHHGFWSDADWLGCRDGKFRPVEPGTFPLANGIPARVGRLRGYGNAIVPQVAAEFIKAFMGAVNE